MPNHSTQHPAMQTIPDSKNGISCPAEYHWCSFLIWNGQSGILCIQYDCPQGTCHHSDIYLSLPRSSNGMKPRSKLFEEAKAITVKVTERVSRYLTCKYPPRDTHLPRNRLVQDWHRDRILVISEILIMQNVALFWCSAWWRITPLSSHFIHAAESCYTPTEGHRKRSSGCRNAQSKISVFHPRVQGP